MELFTLWIILIVLSVLLANYKRRSVGNWILCTLFLGPFALALLLILPKIPIRVMASKILELRKRRALRRGYITSKN